MQMAVIIRFLFIFWLILNAVGLFTVYIFSDKHDISVLESYVSIVRIFLKHNTTSEYIKHLIGIMLLFPVLFFTLLFSVVFHIVYWFIDIFDSKRKAYR